MGTRRPAESLSGMYEGNLVVEGTCHTYHISEENALNPQAVGTGNGLFEIINALHPEGYEMPPEKWFICGALSNGPSYRNMANGRIGRSASPLAYPSDASNGSNRSSVTV